MGTIDTVRARDQFAEVVNRAAYGKERIILTRRGKPLAAIVPLDDVELLRELEDRIDLEEARAALEEVKREGAVPWEKIKADLGL
ncbi:MAG: type II toxin-antitoxin system Phd/YefM family antitoxin [Chloroflexi bacterium]|nr:type II toxin-antitoxin system Phd/YefM family antitoxin [Chloroflexota bacterium]MBI4505739.1 type II toxin-antitoxin system Phd/YefM family antitoxin [Chloroflexota bacterium]